MQRNVKSIEQTNNAPKKKRKKKRKRKKKNKKSTKQLDCFINWSHAKCKTFRFGHFIA